MVKNTTILKIFLGFAAIYLLANLFGQEQMAFYMKPFLLLLLFLSVLVSKKFPTKNILLTALAFSWLGDVLLMFVSNNANFFIFGLIAFLISHLTYIVLFSRQPKTEFENNAALLRFGAGFIVLYLCLMLKVLLPHLGAMRLPVTVYALTISTMLFFAFKGNLNWKKPAGHFVMFGAMFFVVSDSILAFNKFYAPIPFNTFLIMSTYCAAQYLIVKGVLKLNADL